MEVVVFLLIVTAMYLGAGALRFRSIHLNAQDADSRQPRYSTGGTDDLLDLAAALRQSDDVSLNDNCAVAEPVSLTKQSLLMADSERAVI